jgi:transposase
MARRFSEREVRRIVAEAVRKEVTPLRARIAELEAEVARWRRDSTTSSKPPSSDIIKPPPREVSPEGSADEAHCSGRLRKKKRKIGGQVGHRRHERRPFASEQVDAVYEYTWEDAEDLVPLDGPDGWRVVQQVDLVDKPLIVTEHRARRYRCSKTGRIVTAPLPAEVLRAGLVGPRLSAVITHFKGGCRMSYSIIQTWLGDVLGLTLSTGQLAKVVGKASAALAGPHQEVMLQLPKQAKLGIDETGHKDRGKTMWTWCLQNQHLAAFHIDASRGSGVLKALLGEDFAGVIECDYFSAYRKYLKDTPAIVQFCWAHLIREVRFLTTLGDRVVKRWADKLLGVVKKLFKLWHRRHAMSPARFTLAASQLQRHILRTGRRGPARREARAIHKRLRDHGPDYFTFLQLPGAGVFPGAVPGVEPTNNRTERTLRPVVIDRKLTQGTRGTPGQLWCQRIWTTLATCRLQQRSAFAYLVEALDAHFHHRTPPSLMPAGP